MATSHNHAVNPVMTDEAIITGLVNEMKVAESTAVENGWHWRDEDWKPFVDDMTGEEREHLCVYATKGTKTFVITFVRIDGLPDFDHTTIELVERYSRLDQMVQYMQGS